MKKDLEILKELFKLYEAEVEPEEAEESDKPVPGSFEDDPMSFILRKYITLNEMLAELMTEDFKDYVEAIFIVAPKPTTFKILLHNGQYFFLTYLGKAYQATITGRNYYLTEIGEKERAMVAISRLLRYGSPLKTKGPEGAEQGTREGEEGGDDFSGEVDTTADAGADDGGEELTEIYKRIIKQHLLSEAAKETFIKTLRDKFAKTMSPTAAKKSKSGPGQEFRLPLGDDAAAKKTIDNMMKSLGVPPSDYKIKIIAPNDWTGGAYSGKFKTYLVTLTKPFDDFAKGDSAAIVSNAEEGKSTLTAKFLTPSQLDLEGWEYGDGSAIAVDVYDALQKKIKDKNLRSTLISLTEDVVDATQTLEFDSISEIQTYSKNIKFSDNTKKGLEDILPADLNVIGKDYGEVLGAIMLGNIVQLQSGVTFPSGNSPLVDFFVDGYGISSKYQGGAAATLTDMIEGLEEDQLTTPAQKRLHKLFTTAFELSVTDAYLYLAKHIQTPGLQELCDIIGVSEDELTTSAINDYIIDLMGRYQPADEDPRMDKKIQKEFAPFYEAIGRKPSYPLSWGKLNVKNVYHGIVTSPLAYATADAFNANKNYLKGLNEMVSKAEIKQLYLDFSLSSGEIKFKLRAFSDPSATYSFTPSNISVNNPGNGNMAFKMK